MSAMQSNSGDKFAFRFCATSGTDHLEGREPQALKGIVVHRIEVSQEDASYADDALGIAKFFCEHPIGKNATGGAMPYPVVIERDGCVVQTMPLRVVSPHARQYNATTIGVAVVGDFRREPPSPAQYSNLVLVIASLLTRFSLPVAHVWSHDGLQEASSDPNKICPGEFLPMQELRSDVEQALSKEQPTIAWCW